MVYLSQCWKIKLFKCWCVRYWWPGDHSFISEVSFCPHWLIFKSKLLCISSGKQVLNTLYVVYFDQRMHLNGRKQWKTFENHEKSTFFIKGTRGSCKAHEEKQMITSIGVQHYLSTYFFLLFSKMKQKWLKEKKEYFYLQMGYTAPVFWSNYTTFIFLWIFFNV